MKTIELYQKSETTKLQSLLTDYEELLKNNEKLIHKLKNENEDCCDLEKKNIDYEIDISLLRMELNKRLWQDEF